MNQGRTTAAAAAAATPTATPNALVPTPPPPSAPPSHCTNVRAFEAWLAMAKPGDAAVYWNGVGWSTKQKAAVFAAALEASDAGSVALFQRRIAPAWKVGIPHFSYIAVRMSPQAAKNLARIGERAGRGGRVG